MTNSTTDWTHYARELADQLRDNGDLTDPAWHTAIAATPRHLLVPQAWQQNGSPHWDPVTTNGPDGLATVYSTTTLVTKVDQRGWAISSSTKPDLMVRMLETLDIEDGHTVLEIGTGTGYNAALLAHRLGDERVVSVDVDAELVEAARSRLASFDVYPTLATVDGEYGYPDRAPYDRILATCSVPAIPWAWAEQLREGGHLLVSLMPGGQAGNLVSLRKYRDWLAGHFTQRIGRFMAMRHNTPSTNTPKRELASNPTERRTTTPAEPWHTSPLPWFWVVLTVPGLSFAYMLDEHGKPNASRVTAPDGSWATIPFGEGERTIIEAGSTPVWRVIEDAYRLWISTGKPGWERLGLTVTFDHQTIWLDTPDSEHRWPLIPKNQFH